MKKLSEIQALLFQSEIFQGLSQSAIRDLSAFMVPAHFKEGDVILEKGTIGDWMFLIQSGQVKVHNDSHTVAVLENGEIIGELSLLKPETRNMSVTALRDTSTYRIAHNDFFAFAEKNPKALSGIISVLVDRLRTQTAATLRYFEQREQELTKLVEERTIDLQNKNLELERTQKFKEQFLANMSHEIRTPMNAILGMTNLVLETTLSEKQRNYLAGVQKAADNLIHIINDILDLSKIEAGKMELEKIEFSVRDIVEQVVTTLRHKAEEKGIEIFSSVSADVQDVLIGDPVRLYQVLMNLSGNAVKFTEKGSVRIEVNKIPENNGCPLLKFSIADTGIGIPADKFDSIFESFSQAHSSDSRKYGGTGLGLSISKQLVELMGGNISVESEWGSGTTFSFILSLPKGSAEKLKNRNSTHQIDASILNGLRILIADDNTDNRIVCRDTIESRASVTIEEAVNGRDVLDKLSEQDFDIILMDVQMPVMDGLEATKKIRNEFPEPGKNIPIVALTASVIRSDIDKCRAAGMDDYIPKPFKQSQLFTVIAKSTGRELKFLNTNKVQPAEMTKSPSGITDLGYLEEFCEGDKAKMRKYINIFLKRAPVLINVLDTALSENNFEEIATQLHAVKPTLMMMGMSKVKELAGGLETLCRAENRDKDIVYRDTTELVRLVSEAVEELTPKLSL